MIYKSFQFWLIRYAFTYEFALEKYVLYLKRDKYIKPLKKHLLE
jgi:hypothetical protein